MKMKQRGSMRTSMRGGCREVAATVAGGGLPPRRCNDLPSKEPTAPSPFTHLGRT